MGTSLSGLTPATTFDGLLKTSDNEPLDGTLKAISTGDGTDTILSLSNSALQVNGDLNVGSVHKIYQDNTNLNIIGNSGSTALKYFTNFGNNNTNQFGLNNFFRYAVGIGFTSTQSSAMLNIRGSGTTSATTSLLVQNSAGTDMLKVQDDSSLLMYRASNGVELLKIGESGGNAILYANGNTNRSLVLGYENTLTAFNQSVFKTYNGTGYSEAMVITGNSNTSQFVGIGETTPTARLHVKGSGNDNTTTSLLVQNSDAENIMAITDDGYLTYRTPQRELLTLGNGSVLKYGTNSSLSALYNRASIYDGTNTTQFENGNVGIGNGTTTPSARLQVKGSGTTSATTSLLVQNSAGTDLLKVNDDNNVIVASIRAVGNLRLGASGTDRYYLTSAQIHPLGNQDLGRDNSTSYHWNNVYSTGITHITDNTTSSTTLDASAKLQVDSTTQGFLPPRMTTTERDAITSPAAGLMIYNTDTNTAECWNGSAWMPMF